jgi:Mg2+ and Co2+ transporter CorA
MIIKGKIKHMENLRNLNQDLKKIAILAAIILIILIIGGLWDAQTNFLSKISEFLL